MVERVRRTAGGIMFFLIGAFLSELVHEAGHAFFVVVSGGQVTDFIPYPVLLSNQIVLGAVSWTGVPVHMLPVVAIGGEVFQYGFLAIALALLHRTREHRARPVLEVTCILSWLDFPLYVLNNGASIPHWFVIGSARGDIVHFCNLLQVPYSAMYVPAIAQLALGLLVIFHLKRERIKSFLLPAREGDAEMINS